MVRTKIVNVRFICDGHACNYIAQEPIEENVGNRLQCTVEEESGEVSRNMESASEDAKETNDVEAEKDEEQPASHIPAAATAQAPV